MTNKFYVTTPIYYPNDIPHVGHAYTTIAADILARWNKMKGKDVLFVTGTDEHGKKIQDAAKERGMSPQEFVDLMAGKFKDAWVKLNIEYSRFIRTTDKDHEKVVCEVLQKVYDKGDIYLGKYEGYYCTSCEAYLTEKELEDGCCLIHKKKAQLMKEPSYFFRITKYKKEILKFLEGNYVLPENRKKEMINRVKELDRDLSISRTSFDWGIKLPFDEGHVCYVWFDALLNYYTATREKGKKGFWPCNLHITAKDILYFHSVIWPAILMAADIELPKNLFVHGYWTFSGEKISKSRGKVINVDELISITGNVDSVRYFLFRENPFGDDGDFSEEALIDRHNGELVNKLGNLVSRVAGLIEKHGCKNGNDELMLKLNERKIGKLIDGLEFDKALNEIFSFIDKCNEYVQEKKPWETKDSKVLGELKAAILKIADLLWPFIPKSAEKIKKQYNEEQIKKGNVLFDRIKNEA